MHTCTCIEFTIPLHEVRPLRISLTCYWSIVLAFVRKYNSDNMAIKGYTKMNKTPLFQRIEDTLKRSKTELETNQTF